jgi:hypothetical protein
VDLAIQETGDLRPSLACEASASGGCKLTFSPSSCDFKILVMALASTMLEAVNLFGF